ncbi:head GIN domain-containing protein [Sphingomonas sp. IW22]|uniref:head GIN domain-containing protein n=1 Tax=Sphingomonas sp. IW22 TaxID=3242489 RepID=UPI0035212A1B
MRCAAILLAVPLTACGGIAVGGGDPGPRVERSYPLSGFTRVTNAASADVRVTTGNGFEVRVSGNEALVDRLEMKVEDGTLRIGAEERSWGWGNQGSATVEVMMPQIQAAAIVGAGNMTIDRGSGDFSADVAGAGDMAIGRIDGNKVRLTISGAGDIAAAGNAQMLDASVAGTGSIRARELMVRGAKVDVAGAGDVTANVDGDAAVSIAGVGSVDLGHRSRCQVSKAGIGSVKCGN